VLRRALKGLVVSGCYLVRRGIYAAIQRISNDPSITSSARASSDQSEPRQNGNFGPGDQGSKLPLPGTGFLDAETGPPNRGVWVTHQFNTTTSMG